MIKEEGKIKSAEQFLNIVFNNEYEKKEFFNNFELTKEGYEDENNNWWCTFRSLNSVNAIEIVFNDKQSYSGQMIGTDCGEYDLILNSWSRGCAFFEIPNKKCKSIKSLYKNIRETFLTIVKLVYQSEQEDRESYQIKLETGAERYFDKSYDELSEKEQNELRWNLDGEDTYNMMVREGWIDED